MPDVADRADLLALLAYWQELGVDVALDEVPVDWLASPERVPGSGYQPIEAETGTQAPAPTSDPAPLVAGVPGTVPAPPASITGRVPDATRRLDAGPAAPRAPSPTLPTRQFPATPPDAATMAARQAARTAATIEALHETLKRFDGCGLKATAKNLCFYRGSPSARLMIIGEAPGREEDLDGRPFVGRAGQLLDKMLAAIGLGEADVHITNIVYWRPPGNRTPTPQEVQICRPFLERQMELVAPQIVMTLGGPAAQGVLNTTEGIMKVRGKWRTLEMAGRNIKAMPTLHPAYLLRTPAAKRLAWRDLLAIRMALAGQEGARA